MSSRRFYAGKHSQIQPQNMLHSGMFRTAGIFAVGVSTFFFSHTPPQNHEIADKSSKKLTSFLLIIGGQSLLNSCKFLCFKGIFLFFY